MPQVPQELAGLTSLVELDLRQNAACEVGELWFKTVGGEKNCAPQHEKMPVTEQALRFLLKLPAIVAAHVSVSLYEDGGALRKLGAKLRRARNGLDVLRMEPSNELVSPWSCKEEAVEHVLAGYGKSSMPAQVQV